METIDIDCSIGEGGGQVIRSSLALACILGKKLRLSNIRAKRSKPGLQPQHLAGVNALAQMTDAQVEGNAIGATTLSFKPNRKVKGGNYSLNIGTAGAVTLLAQSILPALAFADRQSTLEMTGGTDVPFSPPFDYFSRVLCPTLRELGLKTETTLVKRGFYPAGGGKAIIKINPASRLKPLRVSSRGKLKRVVIDSIVGSLPETIAVRQANSAQKIISQVINDVEINCKHEQTLSPGTSVFIKAEYDHCLAGFSSLGRKGKSAEDVGREAGQQLADHHRQNLAFDEHMADQLMIFCALADGASEYTARQASHVQTNAQVIKQVAGIDVFLQGEKITINGKTPEL